MADYAGAVAAIQQRMRDNWTTTLVAFQNDQPPADPWPPVDATSGNQAAWVYFEVLTTKSSIYAVGLPGAQVWQYVGLIHAHVLVPINSGSLIPQQYARQIGDIFRNQRFYTDTPPNFVWTISPQSDGGSPSDDVAGYWRVTCTIPFEFYLTA